MKKSLEGQTPSRKPRRKTISYMGHSVKLEREQCEPVYALFEAFRTANNYTYAAVLDLAVAALFAGVNTRAAKIYEGQVAQLDPNFDVVRD